jgi:hypothetical protein
MVAYIRRIERMKPGEVYPSVQPIRGLGYVLSWVDSVTAPPAPSWEQARTRAIAAYRDGAAERAIAAKRAELDSMLTGGWSLDSLGALFGGLEHVAEFAAGGNLPGLGRAAASVDSMVFGGSRPPVLGEGAISDWLTFATGFARLRLDARVLPPPMQVTAQVENERRIIVEERLRDYFDGLRKRHAVRILDARLRDVSLPAPPPRPGS